MHPFARWTLAVVGLTLALSVSAAQDPNEKAIGARQSVMKLQSWYAGPLFAMAQGKMDYDAEMARSYAANLNIVANVDGGAMWPQGTDDGAYAGKTRALPEIWSTYPAVADKGKALSEAAAALAEVAGDGLDALRSTIGAVGKACKGCHDDFRAEQN
jgi:cytochrome c556